MINKEEKAIKYAAENHETFFCREIAKKSYEAGWDEALKSQWVNADEQLPDFDDVEKISDKKKYLVRTMYVSTENEIYYTVAYMRNRYKFNVETDRVRVTHWMPIPSFDEIL